MKLVTTIDALQAQLLGFKDRPLSLVPTMGSLHPGHIALIRKAKEKGSCALSLFVNPLQFHDAKDYQTYPQNQKRDIEICKEEGVDLLFMPEAQEIYPEKNALVLQMPSLTQRLCGASRPGHFEGVMLLVLKLFCLFKADFAFFGKKDYQQYRIIKRMTSDLGIATKIVGVECLRDAEGLAYSSRNQLLSLEGRRHAQMIYRALKIAYQAFLDGEEDPEEIKEIAKDMILSASLNSIDYIEIVDKYSLEKIQKLQAQKQEKKGFLIAAAVFCQKVRLIDNLECAWLS